ncbi:MAG: biopolymer transporter ExbD [Myxococcota bacterium]
MSEGTGEAAPPPAGAAPKKKKNRRHWHAKPKKAPEMRSEINVTPLVDVVLVLLIIFMVVTPMLSRGVKVELPETAHHDKVQDTEQLMVSVAADKRVFIDTDFVEPDQVEGAMRKVLDERRRTGKTGEIHVRGDKSLTYGDMRKVLEDIHKAGATQVALATDEEKKAGH